MSTIVSFRSIENKYGVYRGKGYMKTFCESLREQALKIINFKKNKMKLLTKEQQESYENAKICYICKEKFENKYLKDKKYRKVRSLSLYRGIWRCAHSLSDLKYTVPEKTPTFFNNGSNYDYNFIIKVLAKDFKK